MWRSGSPRRPPPAASAWRERYTASAAAVPANRLALADLAPGERSPARRRLWLWPWPAAVLVSDSDTGAAFASCGSPSTENPSTVALLSNPQALAFFMRQRCRFSLPGNPTALSDLTPKNTLPKAEKGKIKGKQFQKQKEKAL